MKQIKLIASDMDGTLLPEGTPDINPEILDVILKLKEKGILFVAASGRQYEGMQGVFAPIADNMIFIADNGAYVTCRGTMMDCFSFDKEILAEILAYVRSLPGAFFMASTPQGSYAEVCDEERIRWLKEGYKIETHLTEDILSLNIPVFKVAAYLPDQDAAIAAAPAIEAFKGRVNVMASGAHWIDFITLDTDKGRALSHIQHQLHIRPEETMAFGDNLNDIGMLNQAAYSYAAAEARQPVKDAASEVLTDGLWDGVLNILKQLL